MENSHSIMKLEREAFASAIRKGLGRALLHVINFGLDGIDDLVLDACLHNYCYDTQLESSRASWLFQMFDNTEYYPEFSEKILDGLRSETNQDNLGQLCILAKEMAKHGNKNAWQALREIVFEQVGTPSSDDWVGRYAWVDLEGAEGFLELARIYGQRLLLDPDDFVPDDLVSLDEEVLKHALFQAAETDAHIGVYKNYLEARDVFKVRSATIDRETFKQQRRKRIRKEYSLTRILEDARNKEGTFPGRYMTFGKHATTDELEKVYSHLFIEKDKDVLLRLLWVFRRAPLPQLDELIFGWAIGKDKELREASINALAQVSNNRVHDLAISKVNIGELLDADSDALELFINNFEEDDIPRIKQALDVLKPNMEDTHSLGYSLLKLSEKHSKVELEDSLRWVYENTSCSNCRYKAVKQLLEWQKLDSTTLYECPFDAEQDIRSFADENSKNHNK